MAKRRRTYMVYNPNEGVQVTLDEISPFLDEMVKNCPDLVTRAARHVGFKMSEQIKDDMRDENIAGTQLPRKSILKNRYGVRKNIKRNALLYRYRKSGRMADEKEFAGDVKDLNQKHGSSKLFGGLIRAIGYQKILGGVRVGWLSHAGAALGKKIQAGRSQARSPRMRRYMFAMGIGMKAHGNITQPARPVIEPEVFRRKDWMAKRFELRMKKYIADAEAIAQERAS